MSKYRKKPVVIEAIQWFKNGDHPDDGELKAEDAPYKSRLYEGKVVRYFRDPDISGSVKCKHCGLLMKDHGWIDTLEGGHIVCPGDYIITGIAGERYPCKSDIFKDTYEPVDETVDESINYNLYLTSNNAKKEFWKRVGNNSSISTEDKIYLSKAIDVLCRLDNLSRR